MASGHDRAPHATAQDVRSPREIRPMIHSTRLSSNASTASIISTTPKAVVGGSLRRCRRRRWANAGERKLRHVCEGGLWCRTVYLATVAARR